MEDRVTRQAIVKREGTLDRNRAAETIQLFDENGDILNLNAAEADNGIPSGGDTGQILAKASGDDFDGEWIDAPTGGGSGEQINAVYRCFASFNSLTPDDGLAGMPAGSHILILNPPTEPEHLSPGLYVTDGTDTPIPVMTGVCPTNTMINSVLKYNDAEAADVGNADRTDSYIIPKGYDMSNGLSESAGAHMGYNAEQVGVYETYPNFGGGRSTNLLSTLQQINDRFGEIGGTPDIFDEEFAMGSTLDLTGTPRKMLILATGSGDDVTVTFPENEGDEGSVWTLWNAHSAGERSLLVKGGNTVPPGAVAEFVRVNVSGNLDWMLYNLRMVQSIE